jgi:hypothetical protein
MLHSACTELPLFDPTPRPGTGTADSALWQVMAATSGELLVVYKKYYGRYIRSVRCRRKHTPRAP